MTGADPGTNRVAAGAAPALRSMKAIGTTAIVAVTTPELIDRAERILRDELAAIDAACSRFRPDADIARVHRAAGTPVRVSALLFEAIQVACTVAEATDGAIDPTVGAAIEALGYDRDYELLAAGADDDRSDDHAADHAHSSTHAPRPAPGWRCIELDVRRRTVRVPAGVRIDLGASAKALAADRAAQRVAGALSTGALVSLGGDVAVAGPPPDGGWAVGIAIDSATAPGEVEQVVAITSGGLASSSTRVRTWRHDGRDVHHVVDPATGDCVEPYWALVSVAAPSCVDANAASTASLVWGPRATARLRELGLPARLVGVDGNVLRMNGWPEDQPHGHADAPEVTT